MTTIKAEKGQVLTTALKENPGKGAVEFAKRYVEELTIEHVQEVCVDLVAGNFEGVDDKKVRRCQFCGYYYEDQTKNNSSLVCSDECKTGKDVVLKAYRRKVREDSKPKRPSFRDKYCAWHLEYPFWLSDFHMAENDRKHGAYSYGDNFERVIGKALLDAKMGGKKKRSQLIDYDGYTKSLPFKVKLSEKLHKTMEHTTIKRSASDIESDLLERYGEKKLTAARREAILFATGKHRI